MHTTPVFVFFNQQAVNFKLIKTKHISATCCSCGISSPRWLAICRDYECAVRNSITKLLWKVTSRPGGPCRFLLWGESQRGGAGWLPSALPLLLSHDARAQEFCDTARAVPPFFTSVHENAGRRTDHVVTVNLKDDRVGLSRGEIGQV